MIFGKHINVYYRKYALALLTGLLALFAVDYLQLKVPEIYQLVINGLNQGYIVENGVQVPFDMAFLLDRICMPMVGIILAIVFGAMAVFSFMLAFIIAVCKEFGMRH